MLVHFQAPAIFAVTTPQFWRTPKRRRTQLQYCSTSRSPALTFDNGQLHIHSIKALYCVIFIQHQALWANWGPLELSTAVMIWVWNSAWLRAKWNFLSTLMGANWYWKDGFCISLASMLITTAVLRRVCVAIYRRMFTILLHGNLGSILLASVVLGSIERSHGNSIRRLSDWLSSFTNAWIYFLWLTYI